MLQILVIDDDPARQDWFSRSLEGLGRVSAARTSADAYALLRKGSFGLAFFDHDLGADGDTGSTIASRILMEADTYHCPRVVWVHSANPVGAANIGSKFRSANVLTLIVDFGSLLSTPVETLRELISKLVLQGNER
jgi:CheY-like chemotaxis protein